MSSVPLVILRSRRRADATLDVLQISDACKLVWEMGADEIIADPDRILQMAVSEDEEGLRESLGQSSFKSQQWSHEWRILTPSGQLKHLRGLGIRDLDSPSEWIVAISDISAEVQSLAALMESERSFKELAKNVPGAIFRYILGPDGAESIEYMSEGCVELWELTPDQIGKDPSPIWKMIFEDDLEAMQQSVATSAQNKSTWMHTWRIKTPSGKVKWLEGRGRPVTLDNGNILWNSFILDVTVQKEAEHSLIEMRNAAVQANNAKSRFLASMSHELRTPLNAILGFSDMVRSEAIGPLNKDTYSEYLDHIVDSGNLLRDMVDDILDLTRLDLNTYDFRDEPINIAKIARESVNRFEILSPNSGINFEVIVSSGFPQKLNADKRMLNQALNNLLSNALKVCSDGDVISLVLDHSDDNISLLVKDTGLGMSPELVERLGEPFLSDQNPSITNDSSKGIGLGFFITKSLVQARGGTVEIETALGKGTTISLTLPKLPFVG